MLTGMIKRTKLQVMIPRREKEQRRSTIYDDIIVNII
jgi:hypothetical protein